MLQEQRVAAGKTKFCERTLDRRPGVVRRIREEQFLGDGSITQTLEQQALSWRQSITQLRHEGRWPTVRDGHRFGEPWKFTSLFLDPLATKRPGQKRQVLLVFDSPPEELANGAVEDELVSLLPGGLISRCRRRGRLDDGRQRLRRARVHREGLPGSTSIRLGSPQPAAVELCLCTFELLAKFIPRLAIDRVELLTVVAAERRQRLSPPSQEVFVGLGHGRQHRSLRVCSSLLSGQTFFDAAGEVPAAVATRHGVR